MNKFFLTVATAFFAFTVLFSGVSPASAQRTSGRLVQEVRPFDFTDQYYESNGVHAYAIADRKNGVDGRSVLDIVNDRRFNGVRVLETFPGYSFDGATIYWNLFGFVTDDSFTFDANGMNARDLARTYPLYVFPTRSIATTDIPSDRQSALIRTDVGYSEKNVLGVSLVLMVEFTDLFFSKAGEEIRRTLEAKNGISLDGTPIIKTVKEIDGLTADGFVTIRRTDGTGRPSHVLARVMKSPEAGGITQDAYLVYIRDQSGQPLMAERHFVDNFECIKKGDSQCF